MLGYIVPDKPELKIREYELYSGYYCGICKSIGRRYGQGERLVLNYDSVLLALILSSLSEKNEEVSLQRCPVHPLKKRLIVSEDPGIEYAADMMLLLAYYKFWDDRMDEGSLKGFIGVNALSGSHKKLMKKYPEKCIMIEERLNALHKLEKTGVSSLDQAAEPFAGIMEIIFAEEDLCATERNAKALRKIGYHIGKWIYLIDAYDDLEENEKTGGYNPLLFWNRDTEDQKKENKARVEYNLLFYLSELASAWETLDCKKNRSMIENIIYFGLLRKTEQVLQKGTTENAKSI